MTKTFILTCDGGGIRGYITASVLQKLVSSSAGNFLPEVNLFAGTSTGSFIALALAANVSIGTIQTKYQQASATTIFTPNPNIPSSAQEHAAALKEVRSRFANLGGIWDTILKYLEYLIYTSYTNTGLIQVAQNLVGSTTTLKQVRGVLVNTLQLDDTSTSPNAWTPLTITNVGDSTYDSMLAWEAGLCSGAAPIYFPPYSPTSAALGFCADGGLFANNPSMAAIANALGRGIAPSDLYVLSLDTGTSADGMSGDVINGWGGPLSMGPIQWLLPFAQTLGGTYTPKFPLLSAIMDSSSDAITQQAAALLGGNYFRVTVPLTSPVALDDTSDAAYATMNAALESYYASQAFSNAVCWLTTNFPTS